MNNEGRRKKFDKSPILTLLPIEEDRKDKETEDHEDPQEQADKDGAPQALALRHPFTTHGNTRISSVAGTPIPAR